MIGEAIPHFEAWLLDDERAVKLVLDVPAADQIPRPDRCESPKVELEGLIEAAAREGRDGTGGEWSDRDEAKAAIARRISPARCRRRKHTGFADFLTDLSEEFGPEFTP